MDGSGPDVRVRVLGPLRVDVGGRTVDAGGGRQRELLARLAVAGGDVVSTDALIDDLWHGEPPSKALGALQVHVSRLRRVLEPDRPPRAPASVLVSDPPGYALALAPDALDSRRFAALVESAAELPPAEAESVLGEALACWSGAAFAGFSDASWAAPEAGRLEELRLVATERRARARLELARPDAAVPDLERLVHDHPLREGAVALLVLALYRAGRQADALTVLHRTRRLLADELGVDPGPELRELERAVLAHDVTSPPAASGTGPATGVEAPTGPTAGIDAVTRPTGRGQREQPELVGRATELDRLRRRADRVDDGTQLVLVTADAGAGKSALAAAFAAERAADGWTVVTGRCPEAAGAPPGWAWREIVDAVLATHPADPATAERLAALEDAGGAGERTFWAGRAVVDLLAAASADGPLLVVLDDLHRAEGETLQILRAAVTGLAGAPVLVLATLRGAEIGQDLEAALAALADPIADRIGLAPLGTGDVVMLLERHGVAHPSPATARLVAERTAGNPLFVRELARLIASEGVAAAEHTVPAGVRDVLRRRLARLPGSARSALSRIAVLGRDADVDVALELAGDPDTGLDALEIGVLSGLLLEPGPGRIRFSHALVCDTLYEDVPRLRRARLHAAALDALVRVHPDDAVPLGHHALAAGTAVAPDLALDLVEAAGHSAAAFGGHREAARFLGAAVGLAGPAGASLDRELSLRCALVTALAQTGDGFAAIAARRDAMARARGTDRISDVLVSYDAPVSWTIRPDQRVDRDLVALLESELDRTTDVALRTRLLSALVFELEGDDDERVRSASAEAVALTEDHDDPVLRCVALNGRFFAALGPDLWHEMQSVGTELLERAAEAGHAGYTTQGHHVLCMVEAARHDLDGAQRHVDAAIAAAPAGQLGMTLGWAEVYSAMRALIAGDLERAEAIYDAVTERLVATGSVNGYAMGVVGRFVVRHAQGRLGEVTDALEALADRLPPTFGDFRAGAFLAAGRPDRAREVWRPDSFLSRSYYWLLWTSVRAEVAVGLGDVEVGRRCYDELAGWAGMLAGVSSGTVTLGPVDLVLADLAALVGRPYTERVAHLRNAVAVADAAGAPLWRARAEKALAALAAEDPTVTP
ncbi:AfsR/SARP family transcriptional regulator [Pseudonocardia endophytica]|uniref:AfsR/SARP family transcriptional regulator n=1 Tax=Pseudonocardia endophytica TaxID=401976 RepID=UPI001A9DFFE1|nr:AfsR/SARP family transcriptional regulator [Pseudonocardia endophytica]